MKKTGMIGIEEIEEIPKRLDKMSKELSGEDEVSLSELFTPSFMGKHTEFSSWEEMVKTAQLEWAKRKVKEAGRKAGFKP